MFKKAVSFIFILIILCLPCFKCLAAEEEIFEKTGVYELENALPDETRKALEQSGIFLQPGKKINTEGVGEYFFSAVKSAGQKPLECGTKMLGLMLISVMVLGVGESVKDKRIADVLGMVCGCACMLCLFGPLCALGQSASDAVGAASGFSLMFTPVYAAILALAGKPATAAVFSGWSVAAGALFSFLLKSVVLPSCAILMGFAVLSCAGESAGSTVASGISKAVKWLMGVCSVIFVSVISLKGVVAAGSDSVALRTAKFVISGGVPVIGSALSDAASAVAGSISVIKNSVGAFGLIAFAYIFIPVVAQNLVWSAVIGFCGFAAELLGLDNLRRTLAAAGSAAGMLLASELFSLAVIAVSAGSALS